jgi:hypothetical protein
MSTTDTPCDPHGMRSTVTTRPCDPADVVSPPRGNWLECEEYAWVSMALPVPAIPGCVLNIETAAGMERHWTR